jgi:Iron dependent repressor, N-terminal DNA binding domain
MAGTAAVAEQALLEALASIGAPARPATAQDSAVDLWLDVPGGPLPVQMKYTSLASIDGLPRLLDCWSRSLPTTVDDHDLLKILVADRVTAAARDLLTESGWGWLDLRGHLHIAAPGLFVHADVKTAGVTAPRPTEPFAGKSGMEVAVELLLDPQQSFGVRALAERIGRSPSTVSETVNRLRQANLIETDLSPVVPDLFWSVASVWRPRSVDVASLPDVTDRAVLTALRVGLNDDLDTGWALSDSPAAVLYGAPIALRKDYPPVFYVPDEAILRRATQLLGTASDNSSRAATLRPAPMKSVCTQRVTGFAKAQWPLAHPLIVALDLAQDPGRGREILTGWIPPKRWSRVW